MFKDEFTKLCNERKTSPTAVCLELGLSNSAYSQWTNTSMPRKATLIKICDYFNLPKDYFEKLDGEQTAQTTKQNQVDDFTYAMYDETIKDLTDEEKQLLLAHVRLFRKTIGK